MRSGPLHSVEGDGGVEGDEPTPVMDCQCKEINVGQLFRSVDPHRFDNIVIEKTDVVSPEFMKRILARFGKPCSDLMDRENIRVAWVRHDSNRPVLGQRTGGPAGSSMLREPPDGGFVKSVVGIQQCNDDVDVKEGAHQ